MTRGSSLTATLAALVGLGVGSAQAAGWYGSANIGALWIEDNDGVISGVSISQEAHTSYAVNGAFGYRFDNNFRAEFEIGYASAGVDLTFRLGAATVKIDSNLNLYSGTVNGYYDFKTGTGITPYVGAGIGVAHQSHDTPRVTVGAVTVPATSDTETDLMAFGEVGAAYRLAAKTELVGSYRYLWIDNGGGGLDDDIAHILRLGVRFDF